MSTYLLSLGSEDKRPGDTTDDFTINFSPPIQIQENWEIALDSMTLWYSYYNISPDYGNQIFRYHNGTTWKNITITAGLYTIDNINEFVHTAMKADGDTGTDVNGNDLFYISLTPNYNTFKLLISVSNSYQVDLTVGNLYQLFGFTQIIVSSSQEGANNVNITNGVDRLLLHLDCITGSYKGGTTSDVLYSFNIDGPPSSLIQIQPYNKIYLPLNRSGFLFQVRIYLTDQKNRRVNLNGEEVSLTLTLRKVASR